MDAEQAMALNPNHHEGDIYVPSLSYGQLPEANIINDTNNLLQFQNTQFSEHDSNNYHLSTSGTSSQHDNIAAQVVPSYDDIFPALPESDNKEHVHVDSNSSKMRFRSSKVTQVFQVAPEERRFRDNAMSSNQLPSSLHPDNTSNILAEIMKDTCTKIETSCSKNGTLTFLITGKSEDVMKAKRRISSELKTQASASLNIPKKHHKYILGKNYKSLRELEQRTNTRIQIPAQSSNCDEIKITGSKDSIDRAIHALQSLSNEMASRATEKLSIPKQFHPFLIGPFGENLNAISEQTGAKINIPPPNVQSDDIIITGKTESVESAKNCLLAIRNEKEKTCKEVCIEVKKSQHRYIIGKGGQTIQEIFKKTGVSIEVPPQDSALETVKLFGSQEKLGLAIQLLFDKAHSAVEQELMVERWIQVRILGPKGSVLKELANKCPSLRVAHFVLDEDKVRFNGLREDVESAYELLSREVNRIRSEITVKDMIVPSKYVPYIIGKNGAIIKQIRSETGVQIIIPSENDNNPTIRIEGSADGVELAYGQLKTRIEALEKKENEYSRDLIVDQRFHKQLIGPKGEKIRETRERFNQVAINIPDSNSKSDKVTIRGSKEDVDECYKYLAQFNKELLANNYKSEVPITKEQCKFVGNNPTIKKIREEMNVKFDFPVDPEEKKLHVTIYGKKDNVEKAKSKLVELLHGFANYIHVDILIDSKYHSALKRKRQTIKDECGADIQIDFPQENVKSEKVTIWGLKKSAMKAKEVLLKLSQDMKENDNVEELKINQKHRKDLQIRYKQHLQDIGDKNNVRVKFHEELDEPEDVIVIKGKSDNVNEAKKECIELIKELESVETKTIDVAMSLYQKYHLNQFFSRKRVEEKIGNVTFRFIVKNEVNDTDEPMKQIMLRGPRDIVNKGETYIRDTLSTMTALECDIEPKYHRLVMGRNWSRVNRIQHDHDVHIKFPERENSNGLSNMATGGDFELNGNTNVSSSVDDQHSVLSDSDKASDKLPVVKYQNIITIYGAKSNCEAAKEVLLASTPIELELQVPYDYHRFIIGQKGKEVREINSKYDVEINVPQASIQSDHIKIIGIKENVEEAKKFILEKVAKLDEEKEDRLAKSYRLEIHVDPKYHSKIIGKKGSNINSLRLKYDVNVQFPDKHDDQANEPQKDEDLIAIIGYESQANAAAEEIQKLVKELSDKITEDIEIDSRIHARLIGTRGKNIKKMMEDYKVEIKFPRNSDPNPNLISITGNPDDVTDAKEHIFDLNEEYMESVFDKPQQHNLSSLITINNRTNSEPSGKGFCVHGGPWEQRKNGDEVSPPDTTNTVEFPSMSGDSMSDQSKVRWGPIPKLPSSNATYQSNYSHLE